MQKLVVFLGQFHGHGGAALRALRPAHGLRAVFPTEGVDGNLVGHHERGIESQAEMPDDAAVFAFRRLILLEEFFRARERDLRDVLAHFVRRHADAVVGNAKRALLLVRHDVHGIIFLGLRLAAGREHFVFRDGVASVRNDFAQENVLVRIQPFFDDGHYILCMNGNAAFFCHIDCLQQWGKPPFYGRNPSFCYIVSLRRLFVKHKLALAMREC